MAGSVNKVILVGNLGRDPEIRAMQSGDKVCNLSIATSERWRDKSSGENREKTEWHRVVIFSQGLVNIAERYLRKGSTVYIEGSLQTRKWTDQQGVEKYSTEVVLQNYNSTLTMIGGRADGQGGGQGGGSYGGGSYGGGGSSYGGGQQGGGTGFGQGPNDSYQGGGSSGDGNAPSFGGPDLDDEIPF